MVNKTLEPSAKFRLPLPTTKDTFKFRFEVHSFVNLSLIGECPFIIDGGLKIAATESFASIYRNTYGLWIFSQLFQTCRSLKVITRYILDLWEKKKYGKIKYKSYQNVLRFKGPFNHWRGKQSNRQILLLKQWRRYLWKLISNSLAVGPSFFRALGSIFFQLLLQ